MFVIFTIIIFVVTVGCTHSQSAAPEIPAKDDTQQLSAFDEYKSSANKTYYHKYNEVRSRQAYEENIKRIEIHNQAYEQGKTSFRMRPNCFADLSNKQYLKGFVRLVQSKRSAADKAREEEVVGSLNMLDEDVPNAVDWREKGFKTPPRNQKSCGSCYAFSVAHSVEGQIFKRTGKLVPLSEQQIVDCSAKMGNHGCSGGSLRNTMKYIEKSGGLMRMQDYPYEATQNRCKYNKDLSIVNITSWAILPARDESSMRMAIAAIGPIAVSINAAPNSFQLYSDGVYDDAECSSSTVNHAMLLVGYTDDYWILKNWWGKNWGEGGYMRLKMGSNMCGVSNFAAYAIV